MAGASGGGEQLTPRQIVRLAAAISADNMASIAEGYLDISDETIKNKKFENRDSAEAFNREILKYWLHRKSGPSQVKKLAAILYEAAEDCSYVDPHKVEAILGITRETTAAQTAAKEVDIDEEELMAIAEDLKPFTEEAMKIDTAPWVKACTEVDMDELYSDLTLERLENQAKGTRGTPIRDYKEMFGDISLNDRSSINNGSVKGETAKRQARKSHPRKRKGKKILLKGDPGMGKTTLMKKIGWDWAKGFFTTFSIVFFVFLKLVEPGEIIENIIVRHTPALEGMSITPKKLRQILDHFSDQCLLILDGLDEHALGHNEDVLKIIRGQKLLFCNIIVTSRPHSTGEVEQYFRTVANVKGFGHDQAKKFASRILNDESKIDEVMSFTPSGFEHLHTCPIIFLILCVLVKEGEIDLQSKSFSNGELYFRLVRCLYKKYTVNKGLDFDVDTFVDLLKKLGKLAWETLRDGNTSLLRSKVIREIGEEAFDYGILIGNEDFRLIGKEAADILVAFPHRTLQEFLGSYHFVLRLSEGESIDSLLGSDCKVPRFMLDSLFLHFCLWWSFSDQRYVSLPNRERAFGAMKSYVLDRLDVIQFEPEVINAIFPACNISHALKMNDPLSLKFFNDLLKNLRNVRVLILQENDPLEFLLGSIAENLTCFSIMFKTMKYGAETFFRPDDWLSKSRLSKMNWGQYYNHMHREGDTGVVLVGKLPSEPFDKVIKHCISRNLVFSMYLFLYQNCTIELSKFMHPNVRKLHVVNYDHCCLSFQEDIPFCPFLTHLYFIKIRRVSNGGIDSSVIPGLAKAVKAGNLPNLSHLCFDDSWYDLGHQIPSFSQCTWSALTHLNLTEGQFDVKDFKALSSANKRGLLPNIKSLLVCDLYRSNKSAITWLFKHPWPNLRKLAIDNISSASGWELTGVFKQGKLKNLTDLTISLGPNQNSEGLHILPDACPNLVSFALGHAGILVEEFASILEQWKLQELDLSNCEKITSCLCKILNNNFHMMQTLILSDCELIPIDLNSLACASVEGKLPNLRHLDISRNLECAGHLESLFDACCLWNNLLSLDFTQVGMDEVYSKREIFARDMEVFCKKVESGCLSSLEKLSFTAYTSSYPTFKQTVPMKQLHKLSILDSIQQCRPGEEGHRVRRGYNVDQNLGSIANMVDSGILPALNVISYVFANCVTLFHPAKPELYRLVQGNVQVFINKSMRENQLILKENV